ncbi:MAG: chemotaxis protein CheW [Deltaproteobacteria bacterium]|nr:chemotaxis protein CheW [Deltaproteobacteria bacterium]
MDEDKDDIELDLLRLRAAELAAPRSDEHETEETTPLLAFSMFGARYAVDLDKVDAVSRIGEIHTIPLTPKHISGVIRRRGETIALVSLRFYFHPEAEGIADSDFALIARASGKRFALQVDDIEGVSHLPRSQLLPPPENFDRAQVPFLAGVTNDGLVVIDLDRLVAAEGFSAFRPVV